MSAIAALDGPARGRDGRAAAPPPRLPPSREARAGRADDLAGVRTAATEVVNDYFKRMLTSVPRSPPTSTTSPSATTEGRDPAARVGVAESAARVAWRSGRASGVRQAAARSATRNAPLDLCQMSLGVARGNAPAGTADRSATKERDWRRAGPRSCSSDRPGPARRPTWSGRTMPRATPTDMWQERERSHRACGSAQPRAHPSPVHGQRRAKDLAVGRDMPPVRPPVGKDRAIG